MFDYLTNLHPLPDTGYTIPVPHDGWQTKDFNNSLDHYIITEDGRLLRDTLGKRISDDWEELNYHGVIYFYDIIHLPYGKRLWVEFKAYFCYGKLDKMEVVETYEYEQRERI